MNYGTADCETDPFYPDRIPTPFIWGLYFDRSYYEFFSTKEFVDNIQKIKARIYIHNGGKFDFYYLLRYVPADTKLTVISGRIVQFKIGECTLCDSFSILPTPLAAFQKQEFEYWKLEKEHRHKHMAEIREYLKSDCVNLFNYIDSFFNQYPQCLTLASTALKVWSKQLNGRVDKTDADFYDKIYPYYYGGRCQVFASGEHKGRIRIYDINSAYPRAMLEEHPAGKTINRHRKFNRKRASSTFYSVAGESMGAFPLRNKKGGIDFPETDGIFHVTGHELITALETETFKLDKIEWALSFGETINYKKYVEHFYKIKLEAEQSGDVAGRLFAKLFLNSLYGKQAADPREYKDYIMIRFGDAPPYGYSAGEVIGDLQICQKPISESQWRFYNLATAASITGWVRAYLWKSIQETKNVIYCDTDSIVTTDPSPAFRLGNSIGDWSLEAEANTFSVAGKKLYAARLNDGGTKIASKGVRLTADEIEKVAKGGTITYNPSVPTYSISTGIGFTKRNIKSTF